MLTLAPSARGASTIAACCAKGLRADINVFDTATIGPEMPTVEYDLPGGAAARAERRRGSRRRSSTAGARPRRRAHRRLPGTVAPRASRADVTLTSPSRRRVVRKSRRACHRTMTADGITGATHPDRRVEGDPRPLPTGEEPSPT
jgi:hypothetical protein